MDRAGPGKRVINRISGWRFLVLLPLGLIVRLWSATLRVRASPEVFARVRNTEIPLLLILWHNRLFAAVNLYRRFRKKRKLFALVSASRDGAWLAALLALLGMGAIRGSSSQRTFGATREILKRLQEDCDVAITPDGPRGPCYDFKPGAARIALQSQSPLLLVSGSFEKFWRLKSWDGFYLPKPFSIIRMRAAYFENYAALEVQSEDQAIALLKEKLLELSGE